MPHGFQSVFDKLEPDLESRFFDGALKQALIDRIILGDQDQGLS
jgi:hypothetical protein